MPDLATTLGLGDQYNNIARNRLTELLDAMDSTNEAVFGPDEIDDTTVIVGQLVKIIEQLTVLIAQTTPRADPAYGQAVRLSMSDFMDGKSATEVPFLTPAVTSGQCNDCGLPYSIGAPIVTVVHPNGGFQECICESCCRREA